MTSLSDTQLVVLSAACQHPDRLVLPLPDHLKGGAAGKVLDSLAGKGLIEEVEARPGEPVWREAGDGTPVTLVATDAAFRALGIEVGAADGSDDAHTDAGDTDAAPDGETAVLADEAMEPADDGGSEAPAEAKPTGDDTATDTGEPVTITPDGMPAVIAEATTRIAVLEGIRDTLVAVGHAEASALAAAEWLDGIIERALNPPAKPARKARSTTPRTPRTDTKQEQVLTLLRRDDGATIDEIAEVTAWERHTIRGFFAGALKKKLGIAVTSEKVEGRGRVYRAPA